MTSTLFLGLLLAFRLWQLAAGPRHPGQLGRYARAVAARPGLARGGGAVLAGLVAGGFVHQLGWAAGLSVWLVALLGAGCLVVALVPLRAVGAAGVGTLYLVCLTLELLF